MALPRMTLILASIRPGDVTLTADGRSLTLDNGVVTSTNEHYQKIFPIRDHPVAICHMGENQLAGKPVRQFLEPFIERLDAGDLTIPEMADELRDYAHAAIRSRLQELAHPAFGCNLWITGFSLQQRQPAMVEVFWKLKQEVLYAENGALQSGYRQFGVLRVIGGSLVRCRRNCCYRAERRTPTRKALEPPELPGLAKW